MSDTISPAQTKKGTFPWEVATPEGTVASGECEFLVVPTTRGELGVLAGHSALVACVTPGQMRVTSAGALTLVTVGHGLVDIRDNKVSLLLSAT